MKEEKVMNEAWLYLIVFAYGIIIGSFLNVCILRIPEENSIVFGHSHCMICNTRIKWYDLIPVFSYLFLGGKCRNCKAKISMQYPVIEALNGILYLLVFHVYGWTWNSVIYCFVISALIVLSMIDLKTNFIYFGNNVFIFVMGLVIVTLEFYYSRSVPLVLEHVIGSFAISAFLFLLHVTTHGMGLGDVYLMAAAGFVVGWKLIVLAFLIGCILAAVVHPIRMKFGNISRVLAFGPYLSAGICISLLFGEKIITWYLQTYL